MRVRYEGPYACLEVDGVRIHRGGEAELTWGQFDRVRGRGALLPRNQEVLAEDDESDGGNDAGEVISHG